MKVSLVVPVQDEEDSIDALMTSIAAQTVSPAEVVVVDAGSRDATRERLRTRGLPPPVTLRVVEEARVFPGLARNAGAEAARHDWLAFTDAGIELSHEWLERLVGALGSPPAAVVYGHYDPVTDTWFRRCAALAYVPAPGPNGIRGPTVTSMLLSRELFRRVGGFPPYRAAEDLRFFDEIRSSGAETAFAPEAKARWSTAPGVGATFRRFRLYSLHNLIAGRGWQWHWGVGRLYGALAPFVALAAVFGGWPLGVGAVGLFFVARAIKAAFVRRGTLDFNVAHPSYILGAAGLLAVIDLATLVGSGDWLLRGRPREAWGRPPDA